MASLTGANAIITLAVAGIFPAPQQLQGFAADDVFDTDAIESAETVMGVDGKLSAGFVYVPVRQNYSLQADSASIFFFDTWWAQQQATRDIFFASGVTLLTAVGKKWAMSRGVLTSYTPIPATKKLLQPQRFSITWESLLPALV